jgi:uncharacterized protein (DUF952 family)
MNYAHPTVDHNKAHYHASQLPQALELAQQQCEVLSNILLELANDHCTGTEHWRDANTDHRKPKLYVIHPLNAVCPIHGDPKPGKRIRTYIGSNPTKIEAAQEAISRHRHYNNAFHELQNLHRSINRAHGNIRQAWIELGLTPPNPPDAVTSALPIHA